MDTTVRVLRTQSLEPRRALQDSFDSTVVNIHIIQGPINSFSPSIALRESPASPFLFSPLNSSFPPSHSNLPITRGSSIEFFPLSPSPKEFDTGKDEDVPSISPNLPHVHPINPCRSIRVMRTTSLQPPSSAVTLQACPPIPERLARRGPSVYTLHSSRLRNGEVKENGEISVSLKSQNETFPERLIEEIKAERRKREREVREELVKRTGEEKQGEAKGKDEGKNSAKEETRRRKFGKERRKRGRNDDSRPSKERKERGDCVDFQSCVPMKRWSREEVSGFILFLGMTRVEQIFSELGVTGLTLSVLDEDDLSLISISEKERKKLLSAIHIRKRQEYDERRKKIALERVEEWLRENVEEEL